jgi:hypothetical protein
LQTEPIWNFWTDPRILTTNNDPLGVKVQSAGWHMFGLLQILEDGDFIVHLAQSAPRSSFSPSLLSITHSRE